MANCNSFKGNTVASDSASHGPEGSSSEVQPMPFDSEYDVFLSFRGEDTRNTFTAHLCDALCRRGINTFIDDPKLRKGQVISPALLTAIEKSMFCIIVLSQKYASSSWCLEELVKILASKTNTPERVLPVFYNVDPSDIRKQKGEFGKSFERLVESLTDPETKNRVKTWRNALIQVANISGWDSRNRHEPVLIKEIMAAVSNKLFSRYSSDEENLSGIHSRVEEVMPLLCMTSSDVVTIGICGMGGIGKTTLANAVYKRISHQFDDLAFLENVGEDFKKHGLISLQQKLLSLLMDDGNLNIKGCTSIERKLRWKKVLIVLDNVKDGALLEFLTANQDLFGPGSRIIVTTREKHLLTSFKVKHYEVKILNEKEAMQVLGRYSSKHELPEADLQELTGRIISYAQGLPLALKIIGPLLFGKKKPEWRSHLDKLESTPHPEIQQVLQISYDELDHKEKNIFLDIACFFNYDDKDHVMEILEACGFFPQCGIGALLDRSLVTISYNKLKMHDLIQVMAMEVVRRNSPNEPGKWSRLWRHEDVSQVLKKQTGTGEEVEGIYFDMSNLQEINFTSEAFARMNKLRLLKVHTSHNSEGTWNITFPKLSRSGDECKVQFCRNFSFPSTDLRYLYWHGYSLKSLPDEFNPENLVEVNMPYSQLYQLWQGKKALESLKFLDLRHSQFLVKTPNLSRATNLERLVLEGCTRLCTINPSLENFKKLVFLNLKGCSNLRNFPSSLESESLEVLDLSGCSKLSQFPNIRGCMQHLSKLSLEGTAIEELPSSIDQSAPRLVEVDLKSCKKLKNLPDGICNLRFLKKLLLSDCPKLESLPHDFGKLKGLRILQVDRTPLRGLPDSFADLRFTLHEVSFGGCGGLSTFASRFLPWKKSYSHDFLFPQLSSFHLLEKVNLSNCNIEDGMQLDFLSLLSSLKHLNLSGNNFVRLPSSFSQLSQLTDLLLHDCRMLKELPELPSITGSLEAAPPDKITFAPYRMKYIELNNCLEFEDYPGFIESFYGNVEETVKLKMLKETENSYPVDTAGAVIPLRTGVPEWFTHQSVGGNLLLTASPNYNCSSFLGFAYCFVLPSKAVDTYCPLLVDCALRFYSVDRGSGECRFPLLYYVAPVQSDHIWMGFLRSPPFKDWDSVDIKFSVLMPEGITITRCGVRLMYKSDNNGTMIEYISAPQSSTVVLKEFDHSVAVDVEAKSTLDAGEPSGSGLEPENDYNGTGSSIEDLQSHGIIDEKDANGSATRQDKEENINNLDKGEPNEMELPGKEPCARKGYKAQEKKNSADRRSLLRWDATFAFGLIFCVVMGSVWMSGRTGRRKTKERKSGGKFHRKELETS